jgi:hypothetical protein
LTLRRVHRNGHFSTSTLMKRVSGWRGAKRARCLSRILHRSVAERAKCSTIRECFLTTSKNSGSSSHHVTRPAPWPRCPCSPCLRCRTPPMLHLALAPSRLSPSTNPLECCISHHAQADTSTEGVARDRSRQCAHTRHGPWPPIASAALALFSLAAVSCRGAFPTVQDAQDARHHAPPHTNGAAGGHGARRHLRRAHIFHMFDLLVDLPFDLLRCLPCTAPHQNGRGAVLARRRETGCAARTRASRHVTHPRTCISFFSISMRILCS